jgi:thiamine biosynthesis protein ThiS
MRVTINGIADEIPESFSITDMLAARKLQEVPVIVLVNDDNIARDKWGLLKLHANDNLEIVRLIGGG